MTLSGAHTVGKVHIVNSGFGISTNSISNNAWDNSPSHFDNNYFEDMIGKVKYKFICICTYLVTITFIIIVIIIYNF